MEQIIFKILDISLSLGISLLMLLIFFKKLNERDAYIKELVEELRAIIDTDNSYKEKLNTSLNELQKEIEILNSKLE